MKFLILDSGILINLSMNGLLYVLEEFKKISDVRFIITRQVRYETIERPINIPRFELGALRVKTLLENGIIEMAESIEVKENEINSETKRLMNLANSSVLVKNRPINIVSEAEISCVALSKILSERKVENIIGIDERTTRYLSEEPDSLIELMSKRLHQRVYLRKENLREFSGIVFIRSAEIVYVAYKKGILHIEDPKALEAVLYATKFHGSSISFEEISVMRKL